jgi:Domain of unknown function (DUF1707)
VSTPIVRASDADRERTATHLQQASADGRLTIEELSERLDRTYAARDTQELAELTSDLPPPPPAPRTHRDAIHHLRVAAAQSATPFIICTFIWLAAGARGQFWPIWVAFPLVLRMLAALRSYGNDRDHDHHGRDRHRDRRGPGGPPGLPPPPSL